LTSGLLVQAAAGNGGMTMEAGAAAVCSPSPILRCWNFPDGSVIPLAPNLMDYHVTQASRSSPRVIAARWGDYWWDLLGLFDPVGDGHLVSRIVLDLRSGRLIVSRKPRDSRCALSPAGDLLAKTLSTSVSGLQASDYRYAQ